jgi:hypothetical protein
MVPWADSDEKPAIYHTITRAVDRRFAFAETDQATSVTEVTDLRFSSSGRSGLLHGRSELPFCSVVQHFGKNQEKRLSDFKARTADRVPEFPLLGSLPYRAACDSSTPSIHQDVRIPMLCVPFNGCPRHRLLA